MRWVKKSTDYAAGGASFFVIGGYLVVSSSIRLTQSLPLVTFTLFVAFGLLLMGIGVYWILRSVGFYRSERLAAGSRLNSHK